MIKANQPPTISNNRYSFHPWIITIGNCTLKKNDEEFFVFCRDHLNNFDDRLLKLVLENLELMEEQHLLFYIRNSYDVDQLINKVARKLSLGCNDPSTSSTEYPIYLGKFRWKTGPSMLDECD